MWIRGQNPSTKYLKGETTIRAVEANGQMTFDFGDDFVLEEEPPSSQEPVWYLLYRVTAEQIFVELSFPSVIDGGRIMDWIERIILDPIDRGPVAPTTRREPDEGDDQGYAVDVAMRQSKVRGGRHAQSVPADRRTHPTRLDP